MAEKETHQACENTNAERAPGLSLFTEQGKKFVLPRKLGDRLLAFVLSCVLTGFFVLQLVRLEKETPIGWLRKALQVLAVDVMFTFAVFSMLALIWALFTPRWLESCVNRSVRKVLTTIAVVLAALVFTILFYTL